MLDSVKERFYQHVLHLQERITKALGELDSAIDCREDCWRRQDAAGEDGGGGRTRAFGGEVIEKAGVNTSLVYGAMEAAFAEKIGVPAQSRLWASGVSVIIHPHNPRVPTVHANFRMICAGDRYWFGGGADLTPFVPIEEDFCAFHQSWRQACAPYGTWRKWKDNCDNYFVNKHRGKEKRGIGGIFFDHHNSGDLQKDFDMVVDISASFIPSWFPLAAKRKDEPWEAQDEEFQLHRRGRYVEFNLLHDRGTSFGLQSGGRTESILISLPPRCRFSYDYVPPAGTPQAKMMGYYLNNDDWNFSS